jgi:large subunit ribosomal protein L15
MQLNDLSPAPGSGKTRKRVGRGIGSGRGKTCGTGHKGQKSRSGGKVKPGFEGGQMPLQMRLPKFGFSSRVARVTAEIRTSELSKVEGDVINLESLRKAGLITAGIKRARIMLSGDVTRKVTVEGVGVTRGAKAAIEKAGGKVIETAAEAKPGKLTGKPKARAEAIAAKRKAEPAADQAQADEAQANEAPADEAQAEEAQADEAPADEAQGNEAKADKAQADKTQGGE